MACYKPLEAWRSGSSKSGSDAIVFNPRESTSGVSIKLPCGQCIGCRLENSRQWAIRCVDEAQMHDKNCFITLTYNKENLPKDGSLDLRHWQLFLKKLRKKVDPCRIRFFHAGEYGEKSFRPHYHALIFGYDFPDRTLLKRSDSGSDIFFSPMLSGLWQKGYASVGNVTFESAAYVARYCVKKVTGQKADEHYLHVATGVLRKPEYVTMSRRPGIGMNWYKKFKTDVYPSDQKVVRGVIRRPPRFYDKVYALEDPIGMEELKFLREKSFNKADNTQARLLVKEEVALARLKARPRKVENVYAA